MAGPAGAAAVGFAAAVKLAGAAYEMLDEVVVGQRVGSRKLSTELQGQYYRRKVAAKG